MENKFIAIVGMCGAGKSVISDFLVSKGFGFFRFGQITLDEVKKQGLEPSEENEKKIRENIRKEHGMAAFAILNKPKIDDLLSRGNVVGDGLYSWSEYKHLKQIYGDKMIVIAVSSPPSLRYERLENRKEIDEKMRNRPMTGEQAKSRDYAEIENIEKAGPIAMADFVVVNDSTKEDLIKKVKDFLVLKGVLEKENEVYVRPTWDEYFMEIAQTVAKRATCDRGRSGCVIARDKQILVSGYVGSPKGLPHCDEVGHQMKTMVHEDGSKSQHCVRTAHAEQNAICQAAKLGVGINGSTLYCRMTPCSTCAKMIINAGIKRVVCEKRYHAGTESEEMFLAAGVELNIMNDEILKYSNQ